MFLDGAKPNSTREPQSIGQTARYEPPNTLTLLLVSPSSSVRQHGTSHQTHSHAPYYSRAPVRRSDSTVRATKHTHTHPTTREPQFVGQVARCDTLLLANLLVLVFRLDSLGVNLARVSRPSVSRPSVSSQHFQDSFAGHVRHDARDTGHLAQHKQ
jgi:hypothetical protein